MSEILSSNWVCFEDLARAEIPSECAANVLLPFYEVLSQKGKNFRVVWRNIPNADHTSEAFNPLCNRGKFYAIEDADQTPKATAMNEFMDDFRKFLISRTK